MTQGPGEERYGSVEVRGYGGKINHTWLLSSFGTRHAASRNTVYFRDYVIVVRAD